VRDHVKSRALPSLPIIAGIVATLACPWQGSFGAEPRWPPGPYKYLVIDQDTRDVLNEFGQNTNIPIAVSEQIRGHLRGPLPITSAEEFLRKLCESQGLVWYFDGTKLYVNPGSDIDSIMITLAPVRFEDLSDRLDKLGIADRRFPLNTTQKGDAVLVSGPPRYLALVRQTYEALVRSAPRPNGDAVRVFRGSP